MSSNSLDLHLRTSYELGDDLNLAAVMRQVLSIAARGVNADAGSILLLDEGGCPSHWFVLNDGKGEFVPPIHTQAIAEQGMTGWVLQRQQGDLVDDLASDPRWLPSSDFPLSGKEGSALCLPLLIYDRAIGVLTLLHPSAGFFQPHHLSLVQSVTDQVALVLENARMHETVRQQAEEMVALYEVTLNISGDQPLDQLVDIIVAQAMGLLRCQGGGVYLWDERESDLKLVAAYGPEIDLHGTRALPEDSLAAHVFETGEPQAVDERGGWGKLSSHTAADEASSGLAPTAALAVPLIWQGRPLGVLITIDRAPGRCFDHHDQHLLSLLANQSIIAITSVQLHEQTSRRLQELVFLNETIQAITATLDLDEIFAILTQRVNDLLGIEACSVALVDRAAGGLVFRAASGGGSETVIGLRVSWGEGIVGAAAMSGKSVIVPDVRKDERWYNEIDKEQDDFVTQSILAAPMLSRGQVVGVVEAFNKRGEFNAEDERLLNALARLAGSVVDNANLFNSARAAEMRYQALFEDAADASWVTDTAGNIIQANHKASALTGRDDQAMLGTPLWALSLPEESKAWQTALAQAVAGEEATVESQVVDAGGVSHPLELRLKQIRVANGLSVEDIQPPVARVQWIGRDISTRRELEQLRENLTDMLVHDLRSPVGTVSSSLELLGELFDDESDRGAQLLRIASQANRRLATLVNSLLDFSRLDAGQELTDRQPISIEPVIRSAVDQLALYIQRKRIRQTIDLPEQLPLVSADGGMIERVLINLMDNALKFTPSDGEVKISVEVKEGAMWVRVQDNGPGILPQDQRRIFDKFARVRGKVAVGGIGLGLAFCRMAVKAHGGRIWVESSSEQGSTFLFTLPLD